MNPHISKEKQNLMASKNQLFLEVVFSVVVVI